MASWPAWHLDLIEQFRVREPDPLERIEFQLAQLTALYVNTHLKKGVAPRRTIDFLPFQDPWKDEQLSERYSEVDMQVLSELM